MLSFPLKMNTQISLRRFLKLFMKMSAVTMPTSKNEEVSFMDAVSTLLKCLKSKRFINDIEKAKAEVSTERIKLRTCLHKMDVL